MKLNKILVCAFASLSILAGSCDKIAEDDYRIFSGAASEWYDGTTGVEDQSQRVFLEKYTGQRCVNCPKADSTIHKAQDKYGNKLIAVSVHDNSAFCTPINNVDLRTEDGNKWSETLGMLSSPKPMALLNRTMSGNNYVQYNPTGSLDGNIDAILEQPATVAIAANADLAEDNMNILVDIEFLQNTTDPLTLTLFLMEDGIVAPQMLPTGTPDSAYVHNHVLRDVITDVWGKDIDAAGNAGTKRRCLISYNGMSSDWNLANCHIVAFVSKKATREILNAAECSITLN